MNYASTHTGARDPRLDTAKTVLIWLVISGHLIEPYIADHFGMRWVYIFIYSFHVPALVFVSGMCARAEFSWAAMCKILTQLVQPLIICHLLFWSMEVLVSGKEMDWFEALTRPYWLLWYLVSLVCWRLMMVPLSRVKMAFVCSVLIALMAGWTKYIGYEGSVSRTLVMLPFFVAGYQISSLNNLPFAGLKKAKAAAIAVLVVFGLAAWWLAANEFKPDWLYHAKSYGRFKLDYFLGAGMRLFTLASAGALIWSLLVLLPRKQNWLSMAGQHSLLPYLTHGFIVYLATALGWFSFWEQIMSPAEIIFASLVIPGAIIALSVNKPMIALQRAIYMPSSLFGVAASRSPNADKKPNPLGA